MLAAGMITTGGRFVSTAINTGAWNWAITGEFRPNWVAATFSAIPGLLHSAATGISAVRQRGNFFTGPPVAKPNGGLLASMGGGGVVTIPGGELPGVTVYAQRTFDWMFAAGIALDVGFIPFDKLTIPSGEAALMIAGRKALWKSIKAARGGKKAVEGIYEFKAASGKTYVGESGNIAARLKRHKASGKLLPGAPVKNTEVLGGKTARQIAEQFRINKLEGIKNLENIRNPIGPARQFLLPKTP